MRGIVVAVLCAWSLPALVWAGTLSNLVITNSSNDGSGSGCCPSCAQTKSGTSIVSQTATSFTTRFAQVIAADARLTVPISISLSSNYSIAFDVSCPVGGYQLTVASQIKGAFTHVDDSLGCGVAGDARSDLTPVSGSQTGGMLSGSLGLPDPGGVAPTSSGVNTAFDKSDTATITGVSTGTSVAHTLSFSWSGLAESAASGFVCGPEAAVRMGLAADDGLCGPTDGISADDYPGAGSRTAASDGHFVTVTLTCLCGNGVIDNGEGCDTGAANGTPGSCCTSDCQVVAAETVCRPPISDCDLPESCTGASGQCPLDGFKPAGLTCLDDGNDCKDDLCDGFGVCTHPDKPLGAPCGGGACDGAGSCAPAPTPTPTPPPPNLCAATPRAGCRTPVAPHKASLQIKNIVGVFQDKADWKWTRGAATSVAEFGDPVHSTNYTWCLYDQSGGIPSLVAYVRIPAGGTCAGADCWKATGTKGFKFKFRAGNQDGASSLILRSGAPGKAKIGFKGIGPQLVLPPPSGGKVLQQDTMAVVQLVNDAAVPVCWEARYSAPATKNTADSFKDKAD